MCLSDLFHVVGDNDGEYWRKRLIEL